MEEREKLYADFVRDFSETLCGITENISYSNIVFLCIGTERLIGDSFGPLVGNRLTSLLSDADKLNVIGTLENNISLSNINEVLGNIRNTYSNPFVVAVDAALSRPEQIGKIIVSEGQLSLGSSLNRKGIQVGDMNIRGIVGRNCMNANQNLIILQNVPLSRVVNMADIVSNGIYNSINYRCNE